MVEVVGGGGVVLSSSLPVPSRGRAGIMFGIYFSVCGRLTAFFFQTLSPTYGIITVAKVHSRSNKCSSYHRRKTVRVGECMYGCDRWRGADEPQGCGNGPAGWTDGFKILYEVFFVGGSGGRRGGGAPSTANSLLLCSIYQAL